MKDIYRQKNSNKAIEFIYINTNENNSDSIINGDLYLL